MAELNQARIPRVYRRSERATLMKEAAAPIHHLNPNNSALERAVRLVKRNLDIEAQHGPVRVIVKDGVRILP